MMMDFFLFPVYLVLGLLFLVAPLLGISSYLKSGRLEKSLKEQASRIVFLEAELAKLTRTPASIAEQEPPAPGMARPAPVAPASPLGSAPRTRGAPKTAGTPDLESLIAGHWLNRIGIVALLLAGSFFLKFAFDNDWIGPGGRVAIGLLAGSALIASSQVFLARGYSYFSDGIAGLGAGVLYLSLYAAHQYYHLVPASAAFAGMALTTVALMGLALGRNSLRIALLALAGGFLTPALLSSGVDAQIQLFSYLAVLNAGLLLLARRRDWDVLPPLALAASIAYYVGWNMQFYREASHLLSSAAFLTLFFVEFSALAVLQGRRGERQNGWQVLLLVLNLACYLIALGDLLYNHHRWQLTLAMLLISLAYLGMMRLAPPSPARQLFAGAALAAATLAIPVQLDGAWIAIAWAVEGTALSASGLRAQVLRLRGAGLALLFLAGLTLMSDIPSAGAFVFNPRFGSFALIVACFGLAAHLALAAAVPLGGNERFAFGVLGVAANVFALWGTSLELWDVFEESRRTGLAQMLSLSLFWACYASGLVLLGVRRDLPALRWQGLALFGVLVGKVFLYDLSLLDRAYRIVSFLALGVVLLVVSFFYQRRQAGIKGENKS